MLASKSPRRREKGLCWRAGVAQNAVETTGNAAMNRKISMRSSVSNNAGSTNKPVACFEFRPRAVATAGVFSHRVVDSAVLGGTWLMVIGSVRAAKRA